VSESWREPFEKALDEDPANHAVRRDLADHLDERGDPDGEPVRWLADRGKWPAPLELRTGEGEWVPRWDWWPNGVTIDAHHPAHSIIPQKVYDLVNGLHGYGRYLTRREAETDFCRCYHEARAAGWSPVED
jgi:hypothetical protein